MEKKRRAASRAGFNFVLEQLSRTTSPNEIAERIRSRVKDPHCHGIIVQLPLPKQLPRAQLLDLIPPVKDVDGLCTTNQVLLRNALKMHAGTPRFVPCAPEAVLHILKTSRVDLSSSKGAIFHRNVHFVISLLSFYL